jgi:hypothetical protein
MALIYLLANRDDALESFDDYLNEDGFMINVDGVEMTPPTEDEISRCLKYC